MKKECIIGIHQPNFFPWLGYFKKIYESDIFVLLNSVPYSKNSWINRTKLLIGGGEKWVTCPVKKMSLITNIKDIPIVNERGKWKKRILSGIKMNYCHSPYYQEVFDVMINILDKEYDSIGDFNINAIKTICSVVGIETELKLQSDFTTQEVFINKGSSRLVHVCIEIGGTSYLAGNGAESYEDVEVYKKNGINFMKSKFDHPVYQQSNNSGDFIPGLSIIDVLMNLGFICTKELISSN